MRTARKSALERIPVLDAAACITVSTEILKESYEEILAVAAASGYGEEDAVRIVLLSGLGYETGRLNLDALNQAANHGTELSSARIDSIVNDLAAYHSMYSVLKYKAFKLYKQNQRLEFNNAGLRAQENMWNEWAERMRRERDALGDEVLRLRALLSEFSLDWDAAGGPPLPKGLLEAASLTEERPSAPVEEPEAVAQTEPDPLTRPSFWQRLRRFFKAD